jgi:hypothetical protein
MISEVGQWPCAMRSDQLQPAIRAAVFYRFYRLVVEEMDKLFSHDPDLYVGRPHGRIHTLLFIEQNK